MLNSFDFVGFGVWNLDSKLLLRIDEELCGRRRDATRTSSMAMTTSTASKLSRERSFAKEAEVET